jgi:hypothetical protein
MSRDENYLSVIPEFSTNANGIRHSNVQINIHAIVKDEFQGAVSFS